MKEKQGEGGLMEMVRQYTNDPQGTHYEGYRNKQKFNMKFNYAGLVKDGPQELVSLYLFKQEVRKDPVGWMI